MIKLAQKSLSLIAISHAISSHSASPCQSLSNFKHISTAPIYRSQLAFAFSKQKKCLTNLDKLEKMKIKLEVMSEFNATILRFIDSLIKQAKHCENFTICMKCKDEVYFRRPLKKIKLMQQMYSLIWKQLVDYQMSFPHLGCYIKAMKNFSKIALTPFETQLRRTVRLPESSLKRLKK